jgi:hypothetical protein
MVDWIQKSMTMGKPFLTAENSPILLCQTRVSRSSEPAKHDKKGVSVMGKVSVVIVDATGNKEQKVGLPDDIKCGIIMVKLVEKIKLPSVGPDGNPISYKFIHKVTGRQLLEAQTLAEAGIKDGDVLRLQPEITAG